jgi:hypothetical protein
MSIQNCKQCGINTRDTDYDLESGYETKDGSWACQECADELLTPPKLRYINTYPRSLEDTIKRLETDLEKMRGLRGHI